MNNISKEKGQKALDYEINTWVKYGAVTVIPPHVAKKIPTEEIIDSRAIWTKRSDQPKPSELNPLVGTWETLGDEVKCRIVGKGFQERCQNSKVFICTAFSIADQDWYILDLS